MSHFWETYSIDGGYLAACFIKSCRYSTWLGHSEPNVASMSPVPKKPKHLEVFRYSERVKWMLRSGKGCIRIILISWDMIELWEATILSQSSLRSTDSKLLGFGLRLRIEGPWRLSSHVWPGNQLQRVYVEVSEFWSRNVGFSNKTFIKVC